MPFRKGDVLERDRDLNGYFESPASSNCKEIQFQVTIIITLLYFFLKFSTNMNSGGTHLYNIE